ncbi:MAG: hypothetical protein JWO20_2396 [Candidatus Angelobacter sp.]|nr:hypothetical protein [Candidatus Angelobacter sp.]
MVLWWSVLVSCGFLCVASGAWAPAKPKPSKYLFAWARSADTSQPDFLAVIDALPTSSAYARVIASISTNVPVNLAHHTDYEMPAGGVLFANDYSSGLTFRFDLRDARSPKLLGMFGAAGPYTHPHSFFHLDNGHVLATYQMRGFLNRAPGALVELDAEGKLIRYSDAADPAVEEFIRPYSLAVIPGLDRVVTSSVDMYNAGISHVVQVWRLSDLKRLKTVRLPPGPRGVEGVNSAEPRLLRDGRTVLVSTSNCGLYRMIRLEGDDPSAELIYDSGAGTSCAVPAVAGNFWIQTVNHGKPQMPLIDLEGHSHAVADNFEASEGHELIALDVSDASKPVEVSKLALAPQDYPHWLSVEPSGTRLVLTGYEKMQNRIVIINVGEHGELTVDSRFHDAASGGEPGIRMDSSRWPHGGAGAAVPHGVVFSRP